MKFGGGSVMFWGCISWWGVGPLVPIGGTMDSTVYVDTLAKHFVPWARDAMEANTGGTKLTPSKTWHQFTPPPIQAGG